MLCYVNRYILNTSCFSNSLVDKTLIHKISYILLYGWRCLYKQRWRIYQIFTTGRRGEIYPPEASGITSRRPMHRNNVRPNCAIRFKNEPPAKSPTPTRSASLESKFPRFIRIPQNSRRSLEILRRQWTRDVNKWLTQLGLFSDAPAARRRCN